MTAQRSTGLPTPFREFVTGITTRMPCHLSCRKARRPAPAAAANCRQVQHWTDDLLARLDRHAKGTGARLIEVITQAGIGFTLVRICEGTRRTERAIKNDGGQVRYCPACTPRPWTGHWQAMPADFIPRTYPCPDLARRR